MSSMISQGLLVGTLSVAAFASVSSADIVAAEYSPVVVLDKDGKETDEATYGGPVHVTRSLGQTLTSTTAGTITTVELPLWHYGTFNGNTPTDDLTIGIWGVDGLGEPDSGNVLASRTLTPGDISDVILTVSGITAIDFSSDLIPLNVGEQIAIVATSNTGGSFSAYHWSGDSANLYAGGTLYFANSNNGTGWFAPGGGGFDGGFRVNVVPSPGAVALLSLAGIATRRRREHSGSPS